MRRKDRERSDPVWIDETLRRSDACHLALLDGGKPYVIPLNFGFERTGDGTLHLYFHCAKEGKTRAHPQNRSRLRRTRIMN